MQSRQLAYFVVAARRQHMGTAAADLGISEPTLSRSIAALERSLGVRLFDRIGRGIRLNAYGNVVLEHSERALGELDECVQKVRSLSENAEEAAVGYIPSLGTTLLSKLVADCKRTKLRVRLRFHEGRGPALRDMLLNGKIDLYVGTLIFPDPAIEWEPLWDESVVAVVRRDHPLAKHETVGFRALARERWLVLKSTATTRRALLDGARSAGYSPDIAFESDDFGAIIELAESGYGIALLPEHSRLPEDSLMAIGIRSGPRRTIGIGRSRSRVITPTIAAVRDLIASSTGHLAGGQTRDTE